ncbi:MAG TPA: DUF445 family protein, partial [Rectinemataceae bacterium]
AIKMLFRPLKPIYIGRFKLPFTPGILPAERLRLSRSIGDTVSRELLSAEVFKARLSDPALELKLREAMDSILEEMLRARPGEILEGLGSKDGKGEQDQAGSGMVAILRHSLGSVLASPEFRQGAEAAAELAASNISNLSFGQILDPDRFTALVAEFAARQRQLSAGSGTEAGPGALAETILGALAGEGGDLFSAKALTPLAEAAGSLMYDSISPLVENLILRPEIRSRLEAQAMDIVRQAIARLNPLQRVIVGVANYERTIEESIPSTIADLASAMGRLLAQPEIKREVVGSLTGWLTGRGSGAPGRSALAQYLMPAFKQFLDETWAEGEEFASRLGSRYETFSRMRVGEALPGFSAAVAPRLASFLIPSGVGSKAFEGTISAFLEGFGRSSNGKSAGELLGIGPEERSGLALLLSRAASQALAAQADKLVAALDIRAMVVERLDSLEMAEAERIILGVVSKELTWITVLGGVLGAIIGLAQGLISLV